MKLSISTDKALQKLYLLDINGRQHDIVLDKEHDLPHGWYELRIEYVDTKVEITDIKINNSSISHMIYTGYYTDQNGQLHQPGTAVWDKGGYFSIWLHTEIGTMLQRMLETIKNGDYGKNLFENYVLTVDRPHYTKDHWPEHIKSFFRTSHGPQWWPMNHVDTPWMNCEIGRVDTAKLVNDLKTFCTYNFEPRPGWRISQKKNKVCDLPFIEIEDIESQTIKDFVLSIGYSRLIDISVNEIDPGVYIDIHRDDYYNFKAYPYLKGCKKFYWSCDGAEGVQFKLGRSGCLPHHRPLLINTIEHPHAVINEGSNTRTTIMAYGELK
jgi:hypothetical protein